MPPRGLATGAQFQGRYEIISELGSGSFGRVYKAVQLSTGQLVALKTLRDRGADARAELQEDRERLHREMRMCASLSHPHIVRLIDFGELDDDGAVYVVFEYVPGTTLRELLDRDGALTEADAVRLMAQVLDAVACAHAQGIVHRDLKPENIMVSSTGLRRNAMVLDFGLGGFTAVAARARALLTESGDMTGTPCYAAPEQLRGDPPLPESDLYSWGLIFLECLTGHLAVDGRTGREVLLKQLGPGPVDIPPPLRERRLGRLLSVVTSKNAEGRRVSMAGILDTLAMLERDSANVAIDQAAPDEGERRQLTVLSLHADTADPAGAFADAEDFDRARRGLCSMCAEVASQVANTIMQPAGDRVVLAFGYPRADEHDARRAVGAALRLMAAQARAADAGWTLSAGVASGVAVVRDLGPVSGASRFDMAGAVCELAAGLERQAPAGQVLVDAETHRLLRDAFPCSEAATARVRGVSHRTFRVLEPASPRRAPARATLSDTPLVGREDESARLARAWQRACAGEPNVVLLTGEPGIGKSRLLRELRRVVPEHAWLECRCAPETASSPLRPMIDLLSSLPEPLELLLERNGFDVSRTMPLFADLLSLPQDPQLEPLRVSPDRARELTLSTLASLFVRIAREDAVVLALEDLQWADPTTLEFLGLLIGEMRAARASSGLFLVCTSRPEFHAAWASDATVITPEKLDRRQIETLVTGLLPEGMQLDSDVIGGVAERTDGVPLFVEELTRAMAAGAGPLDSERRARREIPATLRALLSERLDALSFSARETAQLAATLGRSVRHDVLEAASGKDPWVVQQDVEELLGAHLLYRPRSAEALVFKHALVRDTAYDSMVRSARQRAHARIARAMLDRLPQLVREQPEVVAQHLERAGELLDAAEYWYRAGDRAMRRGAYVEARRQLEAGERALRACPVSDTQRKAEIEVLTALGTVMFTTQGYAAPEVEQTFGRALSLCEDWGHHASVKILSGIIGVYLTRGDADATARLLPQFERMAELENDKVAYVTGNTTVGIVAFWRGDHAAAEDHLARACAGYETAEFQQFAADYGYDGGLFCYGYRVWNLWVLGRHEDSERCYAEMSRLAERSFDPYARSLALSFGMVVAYGRRDAGETAARSARLIELATEQRAHLLFAIGLCGRGGAAMLEGRPADGIDDLEQGLSLVRMAGTAVFSTFYDTFLAEAQLAAGRSEDAGATLEGALATSQATLARFHSAEILRLRGALHERQGNVDAAVGSYRAGLERARETGAAAYEIRCAIALARAGGDAADVGSALRAAYERSAQGHELPELREAEALLASQAFRCAG